VARNDVPAARLADGQPARWSAAGRIVQEAVQTHNASINFVGALRASPNGSTAAGALDPMRAAIAEVHSGHDVGVYRHRDYATCIRLTPWRPEDAQRAASADGSGAQPAARNRGSRDLGREG
jgi:hypothetical protein